MRTFRYFSLLLFLIPFVAKPQDTIYFDSDWLYSNKENATFYSTVSSIPDSINFFLVKDYTKDGRIIMESRYKAISNSIDWSRLYEQGFHDFALETGTCSEFYESGSPKKFFTYEDGTQNGLITNFAESGIKQREYFAQNNIANGEFLEYFEDGSLSFQVNFENDTLNGSAIYYHPNGKIAQKGDFKKGLKFGEWEYFSEDGELIGKEIYKPWFFIDGPDIKIGFPEGLWYLSDTYEENERLNFLFYRTVNPDNSDSENAPSCLISLEGVPQNTNLIDYSSYRRRRLSVDIEKVLTPKDSLYSLSQTVGYRGNYSNSEGKEHSVIVIHSIQNGVGVELILDAESKDFVLLENEIAYVLQSLKK